MILVTEQSGGGQKSASISAIRLVAMLLIILCHLLQYYHLELCFYLNVGVQIFFAISGYLYGNKTIIDPIGFIGRNFKKILIPYFTFLVITVAVYGIICPEQLQVKSLLLAICCAGTLPGLGHLWFVGYILFCYLLTPYLFWLKLKIPEAASLKELFATYLCIGVLSQVLGFAFRSYFTPPFVGCYLIGYFVADIYRRFGWKPLRGLTIVLILLAIVTNTVEVCVKYVYKPELNEIQQYVLSEFSHYGHLFLGIALFLIMLFIFKKARYIGLLRVSDKYSYNVYLVHQMFILSPLSLMSITGIGPLNIVITLIAICLSTSALYFLCEIVKRMTSLQVYR